MKVTVAAIDKNGDNLVDRMLNVLDLSSSREAVQFGLVSQSKTIFEKNAGLLRRKGIVATALAGFVSSKPKTASRYDFLQLNDAAVMFEGKIYAPVNQNSVLEQLSKQTQHCEAQLQTLLTQADGDFWFVMLKEGWLAAGRDPVGVQPLYYGENDNVAAVATNRRALWQLGVANPLSFPPGNITYVDRCGFQFKPIKTLTYNQPTPISLDEAAKKLQKLLEESIRRRTGGLKEVAVAFSGGLDSSLVAFLAAKQGLNVNLLHVSMENEAETEEAIEASDKLNLPIEIALFKDSDVERTLPQVVSLVEESDPVKVAVGLPFYWTAERAAEEDLNVLLAGQGADELFGGYQRYVIEYCKEGSEAVRKKMFSDVVHIHESNLERDLKITGFFDVELRLPFASVNVVDLALSLPIECKMEQKPETLRKLVLRKVALNVGMPASMVGKPKKAVQYSTGVNDAIKRVAKKRGETVSELILMIFKQSRKGL